MVVEKDENQESDLEKLESVRSLLLNSGGSVSGESIESRLEDMDLILNEEFVLKVLETPLIPKENLVLFSKWAASPKNPNGFSFSTTTSLDALVHAICCSGELTRNSMFGLWDIVKEVGEKENGVVTTEILNQLISCFFRLGKGFAGYKVFSHFENFLCVPDADSYYYTLRALCRRSILDHVGPICNKMLNDGKLPEQPDRIGNMICFLCKKRKVKDAHSVYLLAKAKGKYPPQSSVNVLIGSLCDRGEGDDKYVYLALEMLEDFSAGEKRKYAIKPFTSVIQGLCRIKDVEGAKVLLFKMIDAGPPPGNAVFNLIINSLSKAGDLGEAKKIMEVMESRSLKPDVYTYSVIMSGYAKGGEMEEAAKVLAEAKKNHSKLTPVIYHTIIRGYCKIEEFDKAVKLLAEMKNYGVKPTTDEYNKLIQSLCLKAADWETAAKLVKEMKKNGLHLNGSTEGLVRAVKELEEEGVKAKEADPEA